MTRPTRRFEDLRVGETRTSAERTISEAEIIEFASRYDPQWFHNDREAARGSVFGEVVASGIHILALWRQMDHEINGDIDFVCGVGFDQLRLKSALRGGDRFHVTSEIVSLTPSKSGKNRGTAVTRYAMIKQTGEVVVAFDSINLVYTRRGSGAS